MKAWVLSTGVVILSAACLGGCVSREDRIAEMEVSTDQQVCASATDPRTVGFIPRNAGIAKEELERRGITCDEAYFAQIHFLRGKDELRRQIEQNKIVGNHDTDHLIPKLSDPPLPPSANCVSKNDRGVFKMECK